MKQMKKILAMLLALSMVFTLCAFGLADGAEPAKEITLWTYPIGNWGNEDVVNTLVGDFEAETGIHVTVDYLTYTDGDDRVNTAITGGNAPDLLMEGPDRMVAGWGAQGHMVDLADMFDEKDLEEINPTVMDVVTSDDGSVYLYPLVMTAFCAGINVDAFKEAGADQYVDLENHTWTVDGFKAAVKALYDHFGSTAVAVYCAGQGGDQGTRALVTNFHGGTYTTPEHDGYTWDDPENIQAIEELAEMKGEGLDFDASLVGGDEIALFYQGVLKIALCWSIQQQLDPNLAGTGEGLTMNGEQIAFMNFPTPEGVAPVLNGGIWGFGIFDNGDEARIAAAKQFIQYMCDSEHTAEAVKQANYFGVRSSAEDGAVDLSGIWDDNETMKEFNATVVPNMGDYYQISKGWNQARTAWWTMLQKVGEGEDIPTVVAQYCAEANEAAAAG